MNYELKSFFMITISVNLFNNELSPTNLIIPIEFSVVNITKDVHVINFLQIQKQYYCCIFVRVLMRY